MQHVTYLSAVFHEGHLVVEGKGIVDGKHQQRRTDAPHDHQNHAALLKEPHNDDGGQGHEKENKQPVAVGSMNTVSGERRCKVRRVANRERIVVWKGVNKQGKQKGMVTRLNGSFKMSVATHFTTSE